MSVEYGAGKSRIATIVRALKAIGVPVRVVVDFDVLSAEVDLKRITEALGEQWAEVEGNWRMVKSAVDQRRAQIPAADAKKDIDQILDGVTSATLPETAIREIRDVLKRGSAWAEAKRLGKAFVPSGQQAAAYEQLATDFKRMGIYLVEVGELEGFCRTVGGHGPGWVSEVLQRDLANDPELDTARRFATALGRGWPKGPADETAPVAIRHRTVQSDFAEE